MQIFYGTKRKKGERRSWKVTFEMKHTRDVSKLWIIIKLVLLSEKTSESAAIRPGGLLCLRSHSVGPQPLQVGRHGTRGAGCTSFSAGPQPRWLKGQPASENTVFLHFQQCDIYVYFKKQDVFKDVD